MNTVRNATAALLSFTFIAVGCGGIESRRDVKSTTQAGIACPMYCIDGPAACTSDDGTCTFACNQCICEATGGQWFPGVSCPD